MTHDGWLDDHPIAAQSPLYLWVYNRLSDVLTAAERVPGMRDVIIANALLNVHVRTMAELSPTNEQLAQVTELIVVEWIK